MNRTVRIPLTLLAIATLAACGPKRPAASGPSPSAFPGASSPAPTSTPPPVTSRDPVTVPQPPIVPMDQPVTTGDPLSRSAIEEINKNSPLKPVYFAYDSDALDDVARKVMADNAEIMKKYSTWVVTVEGHCDERGTAEYNLALGDRRAIAVKNYLITLGIPAERLKTVSYGNEFPFDPGHDETAWHQNRRAHFMLTAK